MLYWGHTPGYSAYVAAFHFFLGYLHSGRVELSIKLLMKIIQQRLKEIGNNISNWLATEIEMSLAEFLILTVSFTLLGILLAARQPLH